MQRPRTVIPRLLSAVHYRRERPPRLAGAALLSSIAADPHASGAGIGATLLNAYCEEARKEGLRYVYLTTDRNANEPVKRFYERHGFKAEEEIQRPNGRVMVRYVRDLARDLG
jgi:ribosomal protein S18 acetylase RimI-like enzyme